MPWKISRISVAVLAISFATIAHCLGNQAEFDQVAILKCDQKARKFVVIALGKGNAKTVAAEMQSVEDVYLFNSHTAKLSHMHKICLVKLKSHAGGSYQRSITWLDAGDPLDLQLQALGLPKELTKMLSDQTKSLKDVESPGS